MTWLQTAKGYDEASACAKVASEFKDGPCGGCNPNLCGVIQSPTSAPSDPPVSVSIPYLYDFLACMYSRHYSSCSYLTLIIQPPNLSNHPIYLYRANSLQRYQDHLRPLHRLQHPHKLQHYHLLHYQLNSRRPNLCLQCIAAVILVHNKFGIALQLTLMEHTHAVLESTGFRIHKV